ncbi:MULTISPECIES: SRPBCC family protein [Kitasatospora]|uniref:Membrane protein n=2 Tax=Kitasatospora TaxID=2063 RepID=A0ABT1IVD6_9ACTN|nr:SRPBCC family protein [Kitasatospora paracochleata]MCP2309098.1 putative membrane protein [Kitasatospora paracochleata]
MRTLEEQIDVTTPVDRTWELLHRFADYPRFVDGVVRATPHGRNRARLDVEICGVRRAVDAEIVDHGRGRVMTWELVDGVHLRGTFALRPLDGARTQVQLRLEYDPDTLREDIGGPRGFAQSHTVEEAVRTDLEHFKEVVERPPTRR